MHSLDRRAREQRAAAAETRETAELQTNIVAPELGLLPAPDADGSADALDLAAVLRRVKDVVRVLENFRQLRDPARTRAEYMDQVGARRQLCGNFPVGCGLSAGGTQTLVCTPG